jgi:hypothetical protein
VWVKPVNSLVAFHGDKSRAIAAGMEAKNTPHFRIGERLRGGEGDVGGAYG